MRISDWSSDVCSSDLTSDWESTGPTMREGYKDDIAAGRVGAIFNAYTAKYTRELQRMAVEGTRLKIPLIFGYDVIHGHRTIFPISLGEAASWDLQAIEKAARISARSEEHTSELQSLMRISYAVFCLKKKKKQKSD